MSATTTYHSGATQSEADRAAGLSVLPIDQLLVDLSASPKGLSQEEADTRLAHDGYNELAEEKRHPLLKFLSYFWGPIPWMIEAAAILSALVQHWADFGIILALLVGNAVVGFWEEYQAGNTIAALKARLALKARVRRDGKWRSIEARELVSGDLIRVHLGDIVPADVRLLDGESVQVDQSALTGESLPITRAAGDALYSGSILTQGEADALVYATGANTYFGKTARLIEAVQTKSHFQRTIIKIGNYLIALALALVALILLVALFRGENLITTLRFALVLTVAAIPVAMPTVLSVTMAVGARLLAAKQAVVSRLAAIEELAGMDVLCSDKTGTLTQNKLTSGDPFVADGATEEDVYLNAALASRSEDSDPIDEAVLSGIKDTATLNQYTVRHFLPFDPVHKRTEATIEGPDGRMFRVTNGAPQIILNLADPSPETRKEMTDAIQRFAERGFRSLGVARTQNDQWQMVGVLPLLDPPRKDSRETIREIEAMGVQLKMVTGDQAAIARETARQLGLGQNIAEADTLEHAERLAETIAQADGFAQVFPEHKHHIVNALQSCGHIVGMTGDGVNDAPALKKADVGIAVSGATDAARSAADIVLTTPGLSVIADAIRESRKIFQRMHSYAIYRIAETIRVLLFMTLSILVFNFYPVTAAMIVLLALLNDGPILAIAYDRATASDRPDTWQMPQLMGVSTALGIAGVFASFGLFYIAERLLYLDAGAIQTLMFLKLAVAGHLTIFLTRTRKPFWSDMPSQALLWSAIGTKFLATIAAVYGLFMTPITWTQALLVWGYALVWFVINDQIKQAAYRFFDAPGAQIA